MKNYEKRSAALLDIVRRFEQCVWDLDDMQAGDVDGKISPIKHRIRNALQPELEKVRELALVAYQKGD